MWTSLSTSSLERSPRSPPRSRSPPRLSRSPCSRAIRHSFLKLQAALTGSVAERLHSAVIDVTAAVEHDVRDAGLDRALRDQLADDRGRRRVGAFALLESLLGLFVERRARRDRHALQIVDDLSVDVLRRAKHRQARLVVRHLPDLEAGALLPALEERVAFRSHGLLLLAFLAADL